MSETLVLPVDADREQVCYLETVGRVTGRPHEIEIWFAADGDTLYMLSGGRDRADWVKNLRQNRSVRVRIRDARYAGTAWVIEGEDDQLPRRLLAAKYQGWREGAPLSQWARESLPVAIEIAAARETG